MFPTDPPLSMQIRLRRTLAAALVAALGVIASGCSLFQDTTYTMDVVPVGSVEAQLQSLYVIVSPRDEVAEPLSDRSRYADLLDENRIRKYTSFVQFQPEGADTWRQNYTGNQSGYVSHKIKGDTIHLRIKHALIDKASSTIFNVVVLGFFGREGFEAVTVDYSSLNSNADHILQVTGGSLSLRAKE